MTLSRSGLAFEEGTHLVIWSFKSVQVEKCTLSTCGVAMLKRMTLQIFFMLLVLKVTLRILIQNYFY
jgi:hypothetical protein